MIALVVVFNLMAALVVCVAPMALGWFIGEMVPAVENSIASFLMLLSFFNFIDMLVASLVVLLALVMFMHRLAWPPISRLLQVVTDEHVLLKRWPLFLADVGILCVTWPGLGLVAKIFGLKS
jgi:hypothetical protein